MKWLILLVIAVGTGACGTTMHIPTINEKMAMEEARLQRIWAFRTNSEYTQRLHDVSFPILKANTSLCKKRRNTIGIMYNALSEIKDKGFKEVARDSFDIGYLPTIVSIANNSPAERAGLQYGDFVEGVDGISVRGSVKVLGKLIDKYTKAGSPFTLNILRPIKYENPERFEVAIQPTSACNYNINLSLRDDVNAWADGKSVQVTTGMMRFIKSNDDLALIVGHELAHNTLGHIDSKQTNVLLGTLIGAIITAQTGVDVTNTGALTGAAMFSQAFESEADYVGTYYASRAGFDASTAASLWRRMGEAHPGAIHLHGSTHPSTAIRYLAIKKTVEEIKHKKAADLPLEPTLALKGQKKKEGQKKYESHKAKREREKKEKSR